VNRLAWPGTLSSRLGWAVAIPAIALPVALALRRSLSMDEYVYLHLPYEASRGAFAGIDYFFPQFPFMQIVFAPVFWAVRATPEPELGALVMRALFALIATASVYLAFVNYARAKGARFQELGLPLVGVAAAAVTGFASFSERLIEVRPDNVYIFFTLLGLACFPSVPHRGRATLSGALFGCALLCCVKMLVVAALLVAAEAVALLSRKVRERAMGPDGRGFVTGLLGFIALGTLVSSKGHFVRYAERIEGLVAWMRLHETFPTTDTLIQRPGGPGYFTLLKVCLASFAVVVAYAFFVARRRGEGSPPPEGRDEASRPRFNASLIYIALLVAGAASYGIQRTPYEYSRSLLFVVAVPLVADAFATACAAVRLPRVVRALAQWALWLAVVASGVDLIKHEPPGLETQLAALAEVRQATAPSDCVFDFTMIAFFREPAHPNWLTVGGNERALQQKELAGQFPTSILERGCVARMVDSRVIDGQQAPSFMSFLDRHFLPVSPHLYLYSTVLDTGPPAAMGEFTEVVDYSADFYAPQTSWYAVMRPSDGTVRLGPDDSWADRLWLERGHHKIFASRPGIRLLFQPRDGKQMGAYRGAMDVKTISHI